jgi:hypothetical protein
MGYLVPLQNMLFFFLRDSLSGLSKKEFGFNLAQILDTVFVALYVSKGTMYDILTYHGAP